MSTKPSKLDDALNERAEIENSPDEVRNADVKITRGRSGRGRVLQVRLTDEEYAAVEDLAKAQGIPASTYARSLLLDVVAVSEPEAEVSLSDVLSRMAKQIYASAANLERVAQASKVARDTAATYSAFIPTGFPPNADIIAKIHVTDGASVEVPGRTIRTDDGWDISVRKYGEDVSPL